MDINKTQTRSKGSASPFFKSLFRNFFKVFDENLFRVFTIFPFIVQRDIYFRVHVETFGVSSVQPVLRIL